MALLTNWGLFLEDTGHSEGWIDSKALLLNPAKSVLLLTLLTEDILTKGLADQGAGFRSWLEALGLGVESFLEQVLFEHSGLSTSLVRLTCLGVAVHLAAESGLEASHKRITIGALHTAHALLTGLAHIELLLRLLLTDGDALNGQLLEL